MSQLIEQARLNKLDDALNDAITTVGGDASKASSLMDYPDIISKLLTVDPRGIDGRLIGDETILIKDTPAGYALSAIGNSNARLVNDIKISDTKQINKGETIQDVFTYLFTRVLPNMTKNTSDIKNEVVLEFNSIKESLKDINIDIKVIISSHDGRDNYSINDQLYVRCDLLPLTYYLRIRKSTDTEATYISLEKSLKVDGKIYKSDSNGVIHYSINDLPFVSSGLHSNTYYLSISVGEFTKPTFICLEDIISNTGGGNSVIPGSITIEHLNPEIREVIETIPDIKLITNTQTKEIETIKVNNNTIIERVNDQDNKLSTQQNIILQHNTVIENQTTQIQNLNNKIDDVLSTTPEDKETVDGWLDEVLPSTM